LADPSVYEGFGFPPLQAMAAGIPVVATRAGSLEEVVGDAATLVATGDRDALAAALARVLDTAGHAADLAGRGRRHAAGFSWEACAGAMETLYRDAQLRRRVPGGIGRHAEGLLRGLGSLGEAAPPVAVHASRYRGPGADPLTRFGFPVRASALPGVLLVAAWDRGLHPVPGPARLVHTVSLAAPPRRRQPGAAPVVVTVHDLAWRWHPETGTPRGRRWHEAALGRAMAGADALVTSSPPVADELRAAGARRVAVLPLGVDHLPAPDAAGARALLDRLGVGGPFVLSVGTLEPRKNLARLIAAYAEARPSFPEPWPLVVVGPDGWGDSGVGDVDGVVAAGGVDDAVLAGLYATARALAYVPLSEGYGLPPLEAMTAGLAVLSADTVPSTAPAEGRPAVAERVDPTTVAAIASGLVRVCTDEGRRAELVAAGHGLVEPMTWTAAAAAHVALWRSLGEEGS
jgi:glycosyltransferase involved in cell wall biosynthesis